MSTGLIYDARMCNHVDDIHHENPERITSIYETIEKSGLLDKCQMIPIREASDEEILAVHEKSYFNTMKKIPDSTIRDMVMLENKYDSVYFNRHTYECAMLSAGGVVELCSQVVENKVSNGFAIVRPPGHHANSNSAMGFCYFNNVAIAAKAMINKYGLSRIAIIDWDAHHGNATQNMFIDDPKVLYISIHRYDNANFYPRSVIADPFVIGRDEGKGKNVNIAWNSVKRNIIGNSEYAYAFNDIIRPMLKEYKPELIIVSAGFDCAVEDPLGGLHVTPNCFNYLTNELKKFADGKLVLALEGGYNIKSLSLSTLACLQALVGIITPMNNNNNINESAIRSCELTKKAHRSYWKFLALDDEENFSMQNNHIQK